MTVAVVADEDGLARLAPPWRRLWSGVAGASPFLAPDWLLPWWTVFGADGIRPLVAALLRPDGDLAGLLPLYEGGEGKLLPLGVGLSDQAGVLVADDAPSDAASRLLRACLDAAGPGIRRCDLPELAPSDPLLDAAVPASWAAERWDGSPCPVLPLRPEPPIPAVMRRNLRQARHRADRHGSWRVETVEDVAALDEALDDLARLHAARWEERGEPGVLADPGVRRFHRLAAPGLQRAGLLRLARLRIGTDTAGMIQALLDPARIHFYLGGFDPRWRPESPGTLMIGALLDEAAGTGLAEAHFLRGREPYKYAWGARDRVNAGRSFRRI